MTDPFSSGSPISYSYTYNSENQRVRTTLAEGSWWQYEYDALGQVVSGHKFFPDQTPVAGQQFDYSFDNIGNRTQTLAGGDQGGLNQRFVTYGANNLNQYTNRTVPGGFDIVGLAFASNTVTVAGQTAYQKGEYFRNQVSVANNSAAIWTNVIVSETGQTSVTGNVFVAQSPENYSYDADGNLTSDGRWTYTWDGENRLVSMQGLTNVPTGAKLQLNFVYDYQGRRIQKLVSTNNGSGFFAQSTNRFLYDGRSLLVTLNPASSVLQSFVWGTDLSGSPQGAGGIGGLLELNDSVNGVCFPAYDGNGNIGGMVKGTDGTVVAQYEYGPFGEVIRTTGLMAKVNPFRFSTKYQDFESDLLSYSYRFYNQSTGRWLNRDPINEKGGQNLYEAVRNNPANTFDPDGCVTIERYEDTKDVPFYDRCNNMDVFYKLALSGPARAHGFIVQHLRIRQVWWPCDLNDKRVVDDVGEIWEEIQEVNPEDSSTWFGIDENEFAYCPFMINKKPGRGFIELEREVDFFEYSVTGDLTVLWPQNALGWQTGPAVTSAPPWWWNGFTGYEPNAKNKMSLTFNCCCPNRKPNFRDTAGGPLPKYLDE